MCVTTADSKNTVTTWTVSGGKGAQFFTSNCCSITIEPMILNQNIPCPGRLAIHRDAGCLLVVSVGAVRDAKPRHSFRDAPVSQPWTDMTW